MSLLWYSWGSPLGLLVFASAVNHQKHKYSVHGSRGQSVGPVYPRGNAHVRSMYGPSRSPAPRL
ncbi:hypothetical protein BD310DRAFT_937872 [Dichomitus squalens]|uniref:Secreted protein n=1 Tax=Dichomitus squalens TaxID=114155 RepID=A0A4Q9PHZ7_9APHY|nr:hypothetical protein BD310DRAFT_937872 [Dichomitus squalens]